MKNTIHVTNAGNTVVPAYLELRRKGFNVRRERGDSPEAETWYAEKPELLLSAADTVSLLGLVAMVESRGQDWRVSDHEIDEEVLSNPVDRA